MGVAPPTDNAMNKVQEQIPSAKSAASQPKSALPLNPEAGMGVTCAWCGEVIEEGPGPVSHGMCGKCWLALVATVPEL